MKPKWPYDRQNIFSSVPACSDQPPHKHSQRWRGKVRLLHRCSVRSSQSLGGINWVLPLSVTPSSASTDMKECASSQGSWRRTRRTCWHSQKIPAEWKRKWGGGRMKVWFSVRSAETRDTQEHLPDADVWKRFRLYYTLNLRSSANFIYAAHWRTTRSTKDTKYTLKYKTYFKNL